jgi:ADP-L-glycero-D-manno-heptose 6-epimerase
MIVVTGGAGFIGSALIWRLNQAGRRDILLVDRLGTSEKWKNLVGLSFDDVLDKTAFLDKLESGWSGDSIDLILHMGACSATTESNAGYLLENNYRYTLRLATWWQNHPKTRFVYASSAATYGDGSLGYSDAEDQLDRLRPLNMYGYSKHLFDLYARRRGWLSSIVGLKFFNVFGPNEYHKGDMRSVVCKAFPRLREEGKIDLFKSYDPRYGDGGQLRDFLYVKDALEMVMFFVDSPRVNGIYNIGTGKARSWNDVAHAMFSSVKKPSSINYIPMPEHLQGKYQYFTEADLTKLRTAGCGHQCMALETAINDYCGGYLARDGYLGA